MKRFYYFIGLGVISSLVLLLTASAFSAHTQRTALVIGNAQYKQVALRNPVNDAADMAAALKKLGFTVTLVTDANLKKMEKSVRDFGKQLRKGGVGLFYYAGHGLQVGGRNYLIPIDAMIESESDVKYESVDAGRILGKMEDANNDTNIIILDACRDNPFGRGFRSYTRGLARIDAPSGSILAFATAPGDVAADGSDRNGLYTSKLLLHMTAPGIPIEQVFKNVRKEVVMASAGSQVPWESSSLIRDFYFIPKRESSAAPVASSKATIAPSKTKKAQPENQIVASIAPSDNQPKITLRKKEIAYLSRYSLKDMIYRYNFFDSAINRTGSFENKFIDNKDGTITDLATGLMWEKGGSKKTMRIWSISRHMKNMNKRPYAGYTDWRLPTIEELVSILQNNMSTKGMYLDSMFDYTQKRCWTKDGYPIEGAVADYYKGRWVVDFKSGRIKKAQYLLPTMVAGSISGNYVTLEYNYVKAVRSIK